MGLLVAVSPPSDADAPATLGGRRRHRHRRDQLGRRLAGGHAQPLGPAARRLLGRAVGALGPLQHLPCRRLAGPVGRRPGRRTARGRGREPGRPPLHARLRRSSTVPSSGGPTSSTRPRRSASTPSSVCSPTPPPPARCASARSATGLPWCAARSNGTVEQATALVLGPDARGRQRLPGDARRRRAPCATPTTSREGESVPTSREQQLTAIDTRIGQVIEAGPNGADYVVASLSDAGTTERLRLVVARGPHYGPGLLALGVDEAVGPGPGAGRHRDRARGGRAPRAERRRRRPADERPGARQLRAPGRRPGSPRSPTTTRPATRCTGSSSRSSRSSPTASSSSTSSSCSCGRAASARRTAGCAVLSRVRVVAVAAAAVPVSTFLANLLPWWRFPVPMALGRRRGGPVRRGHRDGGAARAVGALGPGPDGDRLGDDDDSCSPSTS